MTTLLDRIHAEIRERMERHREAVEEYRRLEAALAVLDSAPHRPAADGARPTLVEAPPAAEAPAAEAVSDAPAEPEAAEPVAAIPAPADTPDNPALDEPSALAA